MKPIFSYTMTALLVVLLTSTLAAPVSAQSAGDAVDAAEDAADAADNASSGQGGGESGDGSDAAKRPENRARIDSEVVIRSAEYNQDRETVSVTLVASSPNAVMIYDAGVFRKGGTADTETAAIPSGEASTLEVSVTPVNGYVGVGISTDQTEVYGLVMERSTSLLPRNGSQSLALLSGLLLPVLGMFAVARYKRSSGVSYVND